MIKKNAQTEKLFNSEFAFTHSLRYGFRWAPIIYLQYGERYENNWNGPENEMIFIMKKVIA